MNLQPVGSTAVKPPTYFFWQSDQKTTVEITDFGNQYYFVRASKSYRLLKQGEGGRSWIQNLSNVNDYLSQKFPSFQITVDYSDGIVPQATDIPSEGETLGQHSQELLQRKAELQQEIKKLNQSQELGFEEFEDHLDRKIDEREAELEQVNEQISGVKDQLRRKKRELGQWKSNGVMAAYIFTFSTSPDITTSDELQSVVDLHLSNAESYNSRDVSKLTDSRFKLRIEELEEPRVFNRSEHTALLNPVNLNEFIEDYPELEDQLEKLRDKSVAQYRCYALRDLEIDGATFERGRTTPAKAVESIVENLETAQGITNADAPNTGPMIGTIAGTQQVVGFDLFDYGPHYYIAGKTGTGKTHLKRVFIENVASEGYNVLTISPTKRDSIGINLPNESNENGTGLQFDQYAPGHDQLLDLPSDITELFTGRNAVTLYWHRHRQEFINELFTELDGYDLDGRTLYVVLDESQRFNEGEAADAIQVIAQEGRSHGIRLILASQSPKTFKRGSKEVRNNTSFILFNRNYVPDIENMVSDYELTNLSRGECVFADFLELPEMKVDVRDTLTRLWPEEPTDNEINEVDQQFSPQLPDVDSASVATRTDGEGTSETEAVQIPETTADAELSEAEEQVLEFIKQYIQEHGEPPTKSRCRREGPFSDYSKLTETLDSLVEKDVVKPKDVVRGGNDATAFQPL